MSRSSHFVDAVRGALTCPQRLRVPGQILDRARVISLTHREGKIGIAPGWFRGTARCREARNWLTVLVVL